MNTNGVIMNLIETESRYHYLVGQSDMFVRDERLY